MTTSAVILVINKNVDDAGAYDLAKVLAEDRDERPDTVSRSWDLI